MGRLEEIRRELQRQGRAGELEQLAKSSDGQQVCNMLDPEALERALNSGDSGSLQAMLGKVLESEEGRRLARSIQEMLGD